MCRLNFEPFIVQVINQDKYFLKIALIKERIMQLFDEKKI